MTNSTLPQDKADLTPLLRLGVVDSAPWPDYVEQFCLTEADIPELIELATNRDLHAAYSDSTEVWAPVHAWRALAQLKAHQAVCPLISTFDYLYDDDLALEELGRVMAMIGSASLEPLIQYFQEPVVEEFSHVLAASGLTELAKSHPEVRSQVLDVFRSYLRNPDRQSLMLNGCLVSDLLDLKAREAIDEIRYAFAVNSVDATCVGDIEDVEIELGLRDRRATPRPRHHVFAGSAQVLRERLEDPGSACDPYVRLTPKIGRNDPCLCGSGRKHKKCCGANDISIL